MASLPALSQAFSLGSPICEVASLPLLEMSPTLASPPPSGWALQVRRTIYVPGRDVAVSIVHPDAQQSARGVLIWAKSGPSQGAGTFGFDAEIYQSVPPGSGCEDWAATHRSAASKGQDALGFTWRAQQDQGTVLLRAFLIQDCDSPDGCRDQQALTPLLLLEPRLFVGDFEAGG
jgi:hypothetical protein